ncbi:MAG: NAD(P)H-hydrate dehydratase [Brevinematia bacterium]
MKILSREDAKNLDLLIQKEYLFDELVLMENAGIDSYNFLKKKLGKDFYFNVFVIVCGVGNNGGDGLVLARRLLEDDVKVYVFIFGKKEKFSSSTKRNFNILSKLTEVKVFEDFSMEDVINEFNKVIASNTVVVDALFGVGVKSSIREPFSYVIESLNELKNRGVKILSIDLPSGFIPSFNKKEVLSSYPVVKADWTITFFSIKAGMFLPEMKEYLGEVYVSRLGFNERILCSLVKNNVNYLGNLVSFNFPKREVSSNKGSNGKVIFIGGSDNYFGGFLLAVKASMKTPVGYPIAFVLEKFINVIKQYLPDVVSIPLPSGNRGFFSEDDADYIIESNLIKSNDVVVIGNGIGNNQDTMKFFRKLTLGLNNILIIDADGINLLSEDKELLKELIHKNNIVLTPHLKEFSRISGYSLEEVKNDPFYLGRSFALENKINIVLKDNVNYIFFSDGESWVCDMGTPVLARAGSGDVLSGFIGGFTSFTKDIKLGVISGVRLFGEMVYNIPNKTPYPSITEILNSI